MSGVAQNTSAEISSHNAGTHAEPPNMAKRVALVAFVALLVPVYSAVHFAAESPTLRWDFQMFYFVGHMIRDGQSHRLYDFSNQAAAQMKYVDASRIVTAPDLSFPYPAATALIFLPLAFFPMKVAYALWTFANLLLLLATLRLLQQHIAIPEGDWPLFCALLFWPVSSCLLNGQLSILMLALYSAAFVLAKQNRMFAAGLLVGLGALKFQLILGFAVVMLLRRAWKLLAGISVGGLLVALISWALIGTQQMLAWPAFVREVAKSPAGFTREMVNIRGLLDLLQGREPQLWIVATLSVACLIAAAIFQRDLETGFAIAVMAAVATAYHAYLQEMTLLLLPAAVVASRVKWNEKSMFVVVGMLAAVYGLSTARLQPIAMMVFSGLILTMRNGNLETEKLGN